MKTTIVLMFFAMLTVACGQKGNKRELADNNFSVVADVLNKARVTVFYFQGKQKCRTCQTIKEVSREAIAGQFQDNHEVQFVTVDISEHANRAFAEKYQIGWSSLVIATADKHLDITQQAFTLALRDPVALSSLVTSETLKMLANNQP